MTIIHHVAGAYDKNTQTQCCVICGKILQDNRNGLSQEPHHKIPSWPKGDLYEQGKNPTVWFKTLEEHDEHQVKSCRS